MTARLGPFLIFGLVRTLTASSVFAAERAEPWLSGLQPQRARDVDLSCFDQVFSLVGLPVATEGAAAKRHVSQRRRGHFGLERRLC